MSNNFAFSLPEKNISKALARMIPNGGETYTREDVKRIFEEEGVDISDFDDVLNQCIKDGWIIDCGNDIFTR